MNGQEPFEEPQFPVNHSGPGPELRSQVLGKVNRALRTRRRDRRLFWTMLLFVCFSISLNAVVGQRESDRLSRWFPENSSHGSTQFDAADLDQGNDDQHTIWASNYFASVYSHPWR